MLGSRGTIRLSLLLLCATLALLAALALSDDATAWTTHDVNFTNDGDESGSIRDSGGALRPAPDTLEGVVRSPGA